MSDVTRILSQIESGDPSAIRALGSQRVLGQKKALIMKTHVVPAWARVVCLIALLCSARVAPSREPSMREVTVSSPALKDNLLRDPADRSVAIYLPPEYSESGRRYPVVYLLHGYTINNSFWTGKENATGITIHIGKIADELITGGKIQPMIIVAPDCSNTYRGSFYTNSNVTGHWEDFVAKDLVAYIDQNFRTLRVSKSRGIAGHFMGGFGAITIGVKNHDTFSAIFAMAAVPLDFREDTLKVHKQAAALASRKDFDKSEWLIQASVAQAAAFSPSPAVPPFFAEFPCDANGSLRPGVVARWKEHDPCNLIRTHSKSLNSQKLYLDCGLDDDLITQNRYFVQCLRTEGIPHIYEEYDGDHINRIASRLATDVLPFFSRVLVGE